MIHRRVRRDRRENRILRVFCVLRGKRLHRNDVRLAIPNGGAGSLTVTGVSSVILANNHDLSVTTEQESAAIESGATDASRPAGFIRACRLLLDGPRYVSSKGTEYHGRPDGPLLARMSLRHIRGTKFLTARAQRAGTFR